MPGHLHINVAGFRLLSEGYRPRGLSFSRQNSLQTAALTQALCKPRIKTCPRTFCFCHPSWTPLNFYGSCSRTPPRHRFWVYCLPAGDPGPSSLGIQGMCAPAYVSPSPLSSQTAPGQAAWPLWEQHPCWVPALHVGWEGKQLAWSLCSLGELHQGTSRFGVCRGPPPGGWCLAGADRSSRQHCHLPCWSPREAMVCHVDSFN